MVGTDFLLLAVFVIAFGLVSGRLERSAITAPMVFVAFGVLAGPDVLGLVDIELADPVVETILELTLVLVLFTDAARIDAAALRMEFQSPLRMLTLGLGVTVVLGTLVGLPLFPDLGIWELAVLAIVLAPTDAALGQAVVTNERVPQAVRQTLNVESGLNDGIVLPILTVALALAGAAEELESVRFWVEFAAKEIGLGALAGVIVGFVGGRAVGWGHRTGWMNDSFQRLAGLALAVIAFSLAGEIDGNGFIAAFAAGITIGNTSRSVCTPLFDFLEAEGQLLTLLTFLFFGAAAVIPAFEEGTWETFAYALLSLLVIRVAGVLLSLLGVKLHLVTALFLGWFGPRGIASILFGLLVLESSGIGAGREIYQVVTVTVVFSVVLHGVSARFLAERYARFISPMVDHDPEMGEAMPAPDIPYLVPFRR